MNVKFVSRCFARVAVLLVGAGLAFSASAGPLEPVMSLAIKEKAPLLDTLKDLVSIESGSGDREGLDKIGELIAARLRALGGTVEMIEPNPADVYRMVDTPKQIGRMVHARFTVLINADAEYVLVDSIEPRLYLATRMIMDVSQGKNR